jgi:cardiolipin synthase
MVPEIPDHWLVYLVGETYWGELMRHGVKIYKYTPGFLHAKSVLVDGEVGLVGSTNMDYRTFQLHYECAVLMYNMNAVEGLQGDLRRTVAASRRYTLQEWAERPWYRRIFATVLKLFAIWL